MKSNLLVSVASKKVGLRWGKHTRAQQPKQKGKTLKCIVRGYARMSRTCISAALLYRGTGNRHTEENQNGDGKGGEGERFCWKQIARSFVGNQAMEAAGAGMRSEILFVLVVAAFVCVACILSVCSRAA